MLWKKKCFKIVAWWRLDLFLQLLNQGKKDIFCIIFCHHISLEWCYAFTQPCSTFICYNHITLSPFVHVYLSIHTPLLYPFSLHLPDHIGSFLPLSLLLLSHSLSTGHLLPWIIKKACKWVSNVNIFLLRPKNIVFENSDLYSKNAWSKIFHVQ